MASWPPGGPPCGRNNILRFDPWDEGRLSERPWPLSPAELMERDLHPYARALEKSGECFEASGADRQRWTALVEQAQAQGYDPTHVGFNGTQFRLTRRI